MEAKHDESATRGRSAKQSERIPAELRILGTATSMTLAHFGTFDVDNYGDCLYPLLLERRMVETGIKSVHVSPRGIATRWPDSAPTISVEEASACSRQFTSAVLGGGHIVRAHPTSLAFYNYSTLSGHLVSELL